MRQPPILQVHEGGDDGQAAVRTARWGKIRDAYAEGASSLSIDDPDRALMVRQARRICRIVGLPPLELQAPPQARHDQLA